MKRPPLCRSKCTLSSTGKHAHDNLKRICLFVCVCVCVPSSGNRCFNLSLMKSAKKTRTSICTRFVPPTF